MMNNDCHFHDATRCRVLTEMLCDRGQCSFHKTKAEYKEGLKKYPPIDYAYFKETKERRLLKVSENNG